MTSIRNTIAPHIRGYERHAEPAIAALEAREAAQVASITQAAREAGISATDVQAVLTRAGFTVAAPAAARPAGPDTNALRRVAQQLQSEIQAAFARAGQALNL